MSNKYDKETTDSIIVLFTSKLFSSYEEQQVVVTEFANKTPYKAIEIMSKARHLKKSGFDKMEIYKKPVYQRSDKTPPASKADLVTKLEDSTSMYIPSLVNANRADIVTISTFIAVLQNPVKEE